MRLRPGWFSRHVAQAGSALDLVGHIQMSGPDQSCFGFSQGCFGLVSQGCFGLAFFPPDNPAHAQGHSSHVRHGSNIASPRGSTQQ